MCSQGQIKYLIEVDIHALTLEVRCAIVNIGAIEAVLSGNDLPEGSTDLVTLVIVSYRLNDGVGWVECTHRPVFTEHGCTRTISRILAVLVETNVATEALTTHTLAAVSHQFFLHLYGIESL